MPEIPRATRQQSIPGATGRINQAGVVGKGISQVADTVGQIVSDRASVLLEQDNKNKEILFRTQYDDDQRAFKGAEFDKTGSDSFQNIERGKEFRKTMVSKYTKDIENPALKSAFTQYIDSRSGTMLDSLSTHQSGQRAEVSDQARSLTMDGLLKEAFSGESLDDINARWTQTVAEQNNLGIISEEEAIDEIKTGQSNLAEAHLDGLIDADPTAAIEAINNGFYNDYLSQAQQEAFAKKAKQMAADIEKQEINNTEKAEKEEEKRIKTLQEDNATAYTIELSESGTIDIKELRKDLATGEIDRAFFNSIVSDMEGPSKESSDDDEILRIQDGINQGVITRPEILNNPLIISKDKPRLLDKLKSSQDKIFKNDYDNGVDKLKASIITTGLLQALNEGEKERMVSAEAELYDRLKAGEGLKDVLDEMIPRYDSRPNKIKSLPVPSVFGRKPESMMEIEQAKVEVLSKMTDGTINITTQEGQLLAERELRLLKEYQDIFERMATDAR